MALYSSRVIAVVVVVVVVTEKGGSPFEVLADQRTAVSVCLSVCRQ